MKKTQFALAALALVASTAAMADGATVYGTLEAAVGNTTNSGGTTQGTFFAGAGGWVAGNNIGFKGSEDLEGGMKATYQLEAGLNLNNGGVDNGGSSNFFSRIAAIGLSSEMGTLTLGQQLSPYIAAQASGTAGNGHFFVNRIIMGGGTLLGGLHNAAAGSSVTGMGGFFLPNAIVYSTPSIGGFSATIMQTMRNDVKQAATNGVNAIGGTTNGGLQSDSYTAGMVSGAFGDVNVAVGFQDRQNTDKGYTGSASYTMGAATLSGNYTQHTEQGATAVNSYSGSLAYKVTDPLTLSLQYARNNLASAQTLTNLGAQYSLSKRTSAFATYGRGTNGAQSLYDNRVQYTGNTVTTTSTTTAVGLIHSF